MHDGAKSDSKDIIKKMISEKNVDRFKKYVSRLNQICNRQVTNRIIDKVHHFGVIVTFKLKISEIQTFVFFLILSGGFHLKAEKKSYNFSL